MTLPLIYALSKTDAPRHEEMKRLINSESPAAEEIDRLIEFAKAEGGIDYAYQSMEQLRKEAVGILAEYPDNEAKAAFMSLFDFIIKRHN